MSVKPGPWSANPADIDPRYLDLWRGLIAYYDVGFSELPVDLAHQRNATGFDTSMISGLKVVSTVGQGRFWTSGDDGEGIIVPDIAITDKLSVMALISTTDTGAELDTRHVFSRHPGWFMSHSQASGGLRFAVNTGTESEAVIVTTANYNDGVVHLVGGTYDGANIQTYFDGDAANTTAKTGNINVTGFTRIAGYHSDTALNWRGQIMMVAYWDRVLTTAEVRVLYQDPFGLIRPSLFIEDVARFIRDNLVSRKSLRKNSDRLVSQGLLSNRKST